MVYRETNPEKSGCDIFGELKKNRYYFLGTDDLPKDGLRFQI